MKQLVCVITLIISMSLFANEFKYVGFRCKDVAILEQQLLDVPESMMEIKALITYQLEFAKNPPATFEAMQSVILGVLADMFPDYTDDRKLSRVKQYPTMTDTFRDELIQFCKDNPNSYDIHVIMRNKDNPWALNRLKQMLIAEVLNVRNISESVDMLINYQLEGKVTKEEVKDLLEKNNLRYTSLLVKNKDMWTPVVTKIRTMLDIYQ